MPGAWLPGRPPTGSGWPHFMNLDWLHQILPLLRCPDTRQELRWATDAEMAQAGLPPGEKALVRQDGTRMFFIEDGIPNLLPLELGANEGK